MWRSLPCPQVLGTWGTHTVYLTVNEKLRIPLLHIYPNMLYIYTSAFPATERAFDLFGGNLVTRQAMAFFWKMDIRHMGFRLQMRRQRRSNFPQGLKPSLILGAFAA